jgi:hypothetical protein
LRISINGKQRFAHRLAFLLMTGCCPKFVDHIDGNRSNNRWNNLREASIQINQQNLRSAQKNNTSGYLGVMYHKNRKKPWSARIYADGKHRHLGYFADPAAAHERYLEEKRRLHGGCTI